MYDICAKYFKSSSKLFSKFLVQVYLEAPLIPGLDWEVATTSVTYQSVSSSRTDESVVSMARHCRGQQTRNPALPQPSSGCRATQSM